VTDLHGIYRFGLGGTLAVDERSEVIFSIPRGTLPYQLIFLLTEFAFFRHARSPKRNGIGTGYSCFRSRIGSRVWSVEWHHFKLP